MAMLLLALRSSEPTETPFAINSDKFDFMADIFTNMLRFNNREFSISVYEDAIKLGMDKATNTINRIQIQKAGRVADRR